MTRRGATGNIVHRQHLSKSKAGVEARVKAGMDRLQIGEGKCAEAVDGQRSGLAQIGERTLDGLPGGVLGEVGADDDFESGFGGPPLLGPEALDEVVIHGTQAAGGWGVIGSASFRISRCRAPGFLRWHRFNLRIG